MLTNETRVIDLSVGQLRAMFREENSTKNPTELLPPPPKILKRKEVAEFFSISLVTLGKWVKKGKLIQHHMGSRRYFIESEVHGALLSNNKGGRHEKK